MTPKEILKVIVAKLFNGVDVDDLSKDEKRLLKILKKEGVVYIQTEYVASFTSEQSDEDYQFVYPNWGYFDEDQSPAVEEPEET